MKTAEPALGPQPLTTSADFAGVAREVLWANAHSPLYVAGLVREVLITSPTTGYFGAVAREVLLTAPPPPAGAGQYAVTIIV